jgi:hypothetical protein
MALCPFAIYEPVTNHGGDVVGHWGLVIHVQVGLGDTAGQDDNPASEVSDTFWCGLDGTLKQHLDTDIEGWTQMYGNENYAGVECEGFPANPMTDAQIATLGKLFAWFVQTYPDTIPLQLCDHGGQGLTTHCFYPSGVADSTWGGHPCPGSGDLPLAEATSPRFYQIPAILAVAETIINPPPVEENQVQTVNYTAGPATPGGVAFSPAFPLPAGTTTCVSVYVRAKRRTTAPDGDGPATPHANPVAGPPVGMCIIRLDGCQPGETYNGTASFQ